jgi:hypothetical protein
MHEDGCDNCGRVAELYHNEASGLAFCESCDMASEIDAEDAAEAPFHAELRLIIEQVEGTPLAALVPHAEALLALPEESVAALVEAAQSMVVGASAGR